MGGWSDFQEDLQQAFARQEDGSTLKRALRVATSQGVLALGVYRFGRWVHAEQERVFAMRLLKPLHFALSKVGEVVTGIKLYPDAQIGAGCYIHNFGGVVVSGQLGRDCVLVQGAQLISRSDGRGAGSPTLGDRVYVGSGAKILGPVQVGDDARIGANAVVLTSVPAGATAVGVPARVVQRKR
jgi:serine O-acetyltransferase